MVEQTVLMEEMRAGVQKSDQLRPKYVPWKYYE